MKYIPALILVVAACGGDDSSSDDIRDEPSYVEACAATETRGPDPVLAVDWTYSYDGSRLVENGDHGSTGSTDETWTWQFSPAGRMLSLHWTEFGADAYDERRTFDEADNLIRELVDFDGAGESAAETTEHTYDGDLVVETTFDGETDGTIDTRTLYTYDEADNEIRRDIDTDNDGTTNDVELRTYQGELVTLIETDLGADQLIDRTTTITYDASDDLVALQTVDAEGAVTRDVVITRDSRGNITSRRDERSSAAFDLVLQIDGTFDDRDRLLTSSFSVLFDGELSSSSSTVFAYECP